MNADNKIPANPEEEQKNQGTQNVLKLFFLAAILIAAWFVLDWLINK